MIRNIPPQLDTSRIDQMISNATSRKQETRKTFWTRLAGFRAGLRHSRPAYGFGAALVAASIAGVFWLGPMNPEEDVKKISVQDQAYDTEISDYVLYDILEDLS